MAVVYNLMYYFCHYYIFLKTAKSQKWVMPLAQAKLLPSPLSSPPKTFFSKQYFLSEIFVLLQLSNSLLTLVVVTRDHHYSLHNDLARRRK